MPKKDVVYPIQEERIYTSLDDIRSRQPKQKYFSLNQTAKYLGLSPKTLYKWLGENMIPAYKLGGVWRFDITEVDRLVKEGKFVNLAPR